jgi:hypothetical protein
MAHIAGRGSLVRQLRPYNLQVTFNTEIIQAIINSPKII